MQRTVTFQPSLTLTFIVMLLQNKRGPKFIVKEMESMYVEELRSAVNLLMANLESLPVSKGNTESKYSLQKLKRYVGICM